MRRRKAFAPKYLDPGTVVGWLSEDYGHRQGTVWAAGPKGPRSIWVVPDGSLPGEAPAILLTVSQRRGCPPILHEQGTSEANPLGRMSRADWQRHLAAAYAAVWASPAESLVGRTGLPSDIHMLAVARAQASWTAERVDVTGRIPATGQLARAA